MSSPIRVALPLAWPGNRSRSCLARVVAVLLPVLVALAPGFPQAKLPGFLENGFGGAKESKTSAGADAGRAGISTREPAAVAATILSAGRTAAYLARSGSELLLYRSGGEAPLRLPEPRGALALPDDLAGRLKPNQELVIDSALAETIQPIAGRLAESYRLAIFDPRYGSRPVVRSGVDAADLLVALQPGLSIPLRHAAIPSDIWSLLGRPLAPQRVRALALVSKEDPDTLARLLQAGGDRIAILLRSDEPFSLRDFRNGVAILIGHVEEGAFVLPGAGSVPARRIGFAEVEAEAARNNTTVLYVGCKTFSEGTGTGYLREVLDSEVAEGLRRGLKANTYRELLAAFGTTSSPLVIIPDAFRREANSLVLAAERLHAQDERLHRGAGSVRLTTRFAPLSTLVDTNLLLCAATLSILIAIGLQTSWASYDRMFPALPYRALRPRAFRMAHGGKLLLFGLLLPLSVLWTTSLVLLFVGWEKREGYFELFWSLFLHRTRLAALFACVGLLVVGLGVVLHLA
jgi:hypothetical protein